MFKDRTKVSLKLETYKSLVKPVLMYNCWKWEITKNEEKNTNPFHTQQLQLRRMLNVKYPCKMSNKKVYKITKENPL